MTPTLSSLAEHFAFWQARAQAWWTRANRFGLMLRVTVWASGFAALMLAAPPEARWTFGLGLAVLFPLVPMAKPQLSWATGVEVVVLCMWFIATVGDEYPSILWAGFLGTAMYVHHAATTACAQWRADADVPVAVRRSWLWRTGVIAGASVGIATVVSVLAQNPLPFAPPVLVIVALLLAGGVIFVLAMRAARR